MISQDVNHDEYEKLEKVSGFSRLDILSFKAQVPANAIPRIPASSCLGLGGKVANPKSTLLGKSTGC